MPTKALDEELAKALMDRRIRPTGVGGECEMGFLEV